jgi:uncharacterized membrane protein YqjE
MATTDALARPERSVGELFNELASETGTLVRQEVQLATTELSQKAAYAGRRLVRVVAGGSLALVALMTLTAAIVLLLGHAIPLWVSALIVAVVMGVAGYALARAGLQAMNRADLTPHETISSLKEDKSWMTNLFH